MSLRSYSCFVWSFSIWKCLFLFQEWVFYKLKSIFKVVATLIYNIILWDTEKKCLCQPTVELDWHGHLGISIFLKAAHCIAKIENHWWIVWDLYTFLRQLLKLTRFYSWVIIITLFSTSLARISDMFLDRNFL